MDLTGFNRANGQMTGGIWNPCNENEPANRSNKTNSAQDTNAKGLSRARSGVFRMDSPSHLHIESRPRNKAELFAAVEIVVDLHKIPAIIFDVPDVALRSAEKHLNRHTCHHMILEMTVFIDQLAVNVPHSSLISGGSHSKVMVYIRTRENGMKLQEARYFSRNG